MAGVVGTGGVDAEARTEPAHGSLTGPNTRLNGVPDFPELIGRLACVGGERHSWDPFSIFCSRRTGMNAVPGICRFH